MKRSRLRKGAPKKKTRLPYSYLYMVSVAEYNIDYPEFEKSFVKHGGTERMSRHVWDKWKIDKKGDFLAMVGNLDLENQRIVQKVIDEDIERRKKIWIKKGLV